MSLHERDCPYCGTLAQWRSADPVPSKCLSCGAPPKRASRSKSEAGDIRLDILYGFACARHDWQPRLVAEHMAEVTGLRDQLTGLAFLA